MSPFEIEFLLHSHLIPEPYPHLDNLVFHKAMKKLVTLGLIEDRGDGIFGTTEGGKMFVEALCDVPAPVSKMSWSFPQD
jgi:hypothetical protein